LSQPVAFDTVAQVFGGDVCPAVEEWWRMVVVDGKHAVVVSWWGL
jgi:hypothetical protein